MRKSKKIIDLLNYNTNVNSFLLSIQLQNHENNLDGFYYYFTNEKFILNNKLKRKLKPFIKISQSLKNFDKFNKKRLKNKNKSFKIKKTTFVVKYRKKIIYLFSPSNEKYTYAINQIANGNYLKFLDEFILIWNKYEDLKIGMKRSWFLEYENDIKKTYIDYFSDYYKNLE